MENEYRGRPVYGIIAAPANDCVVGVHIGLQSHILPLVETINPPNIPKFSDQHIIRTEDSVVVVKVQAEITVYPRVTTLIKIEESVRASLLETMEEDGIVPTPEAYARGLRAVVQHVACRMQRCGVEIS